MEVPDPAKLRNWGLIVASVVLTIVAAAGWVWTADAQHEANAGAIVAVEALVAENTTKIAQVSTDVRELTKLFTVDMESRSSERAAQRAAARVMVKLCKQPEFRFDNKGNCAFYEQLLMLIGEKE